MKTPRAKAWLCAGCLWWAALPAGAEKAPIAPLQIHATTLPAACPPEAWQYHARDLQRAAQGHAPESLVALAHAALCGSGGSARATLLRHAPRCIRYAWDYTGQEAEAAWLAPGEALAPRDGRAWNLAIHSSAGRQVTLQFQADEACVVGLRLKAWRQSWLIVGAEEACD